MVLLLSTLGCAMHATLIGRIEPAPPVVLTTPEGTSYRLTAGTDQGLIGSLDGCQIRAEGTRFGHHFWVRDFLVMDGGDGSAPFFGGLRRFGSNWLLDDRNSGQELLLDPTTLAGLDQHDGDVVLVVGYVVGPSTIAVVQWRVLVEG